MAKKLQRQEIAPIKYMKSVGSSIIHLDPKLSAMIEAERGNNEENDENNESNEGDSFAESREEAIQQEVLGERSQDLDQPRPIRNRQQVRRIRNRQVQRLRPSPSPRFVLEIIFKKNNVFNILPDP